ncbi:Ltp family lipoprotein [Mycolicibacterium mengxianglii]|uniref:Ltp family lipoprotein n=1 Tax=Mycolicibacterium mengxianglii TaxID=2736649 RepID=UPI0018EED005|nr:Ltp family lipoprotein [Mycolicibacterium mengxianglii]
MKKWCISAFAAVTLIATSGVAAGTVQAVPFVPLTPVGQLPLTPTSQQSAIRSAQSYLEVAGLSRSGMIEQLTSIDQFTPSEAAYGATAVGL